MSAKDFAATEHSAINMQRLLAATIKERIQAGTLSNETICILSFDNGSHVDISEEEGKTVIAFIRASAKVAGLPT